MKLKSHRGSKKTAEAVPESHYETCVCCKTATSVLKSAPVECRENYIYGVGQLCSRCAAQLKHTNLSYDTTREIIEEIALKGN